MPDGSNSNQIPYGRELQCSIPQSANPPFIIMGMPRSRTFWLSKFLSYGQWTCGHEEGRYLRTIADARSWLSQEKAGSSETGIAGHWRLLKKMRPDVRIVTIRRPVDEVVRSFNAACGIDLSAQITPVFKKLDAKLNQIEKRIPGVISIQSQDLAKEETCAMLFEHCLPYKHDHNWWAMHDRANLQVNLPALLRYMAACAPQLSTILSVASQESRKLMWAGKKPHDKDGMTFEAIPFDVWLEDAQSLLSQHHADCDQASDAFDYKNIDLFRRLDAAGALQTIVAKANGRMFGYLISVLGDSFEFTDSGIAVQTAFFRAPDAPGLGSRLIQASVDLLNKQRGGRWEIIQRAGRRASGPALGKLFKKMGAEEYGEIYRLSIGMD